MPEHQHNFFSDLFHRLVHRLLRLSALRVIALFLILAMLVAISMVMTIDWLWDGRFSAELEFSGVVVSFLDGLLIVGLLSVLLNELRGEVVRRQQVEEDIRKMNAELEKMVQGRTRQLLDAQEELVRTEKLAVLGQVADTVGHELRNPLGVMNNAVYYLQAVLPDADETIREYLGIIKDEIADAERIVSDLLDAVRTKPPNPERVGLAAALEQTLRKCDIPPAVQISLDIPAEMAAVKVDPMHLHQVLWNLITNGVEAMPQGGMLTIRAAADQVAHTVQVDIADSGGGMTPEQQARLFQPMFTTKARRIGLGLVVVKNLVHANGGSVAAESRPGVGSTFTITLPGAD